MRILTSLFGIIIIFAAVTFALANRQTAIVSLWPFNLEVPALLGPFVLGAFFLGLLLGALITWFSLLPHRFKARRLRKDMAKLQDKIDDLQRTVLPPEDSAPKSRWSLTSR